MAQRLVELTERYCVVYRTLRNSPAITLHTRHLAAGEEPPAAGVEGTAHAEAEMQARLHVIQAAASPAL